MKKLWLLLGVVHCGFGMDTTADMVCVDVAGGNSENIFSEFASSRNIYSPTQARFKSGTITQDNDSGLLELIKSDMQEHQTASHSHATKKIVDNNIWYKLHPENSFHQKCTVVQSAIGAGNNEYCKANDRINYFCGTDHAVNNSGQYLYDVKLKFIDSLKPFFTNFSEVLNQLLDINEEIRRDDSSCPDTNLRPVTCKNLVYFKDRMISQSADSTEEIADLDLVRERCLKMIDTIEAEVAGTDNEIKSVWKQKMRTHDPRFCDYYTRQKYWPYFRDNVLPELLAKHNCIFKEILAKRALKMIAQYKRKKTQETSGVAGTSSAALLNAESAAHSSTQA